MNLKAKVLVALMCVMMLSTSGYAFRFSVGGFGGLNMPVAQEDTKSGTAFGAKARIPLMGSLAIEPNILFAEEWRCRI